MLLAPIRVELDTETHRIRDYFTWNVNGELPVWPCVAEASSLPTRCAPRPFLETLITPEEFATTLCRDLNISAVAYREPIATMIRQQTEEYAELLLIDAMDEMDNDVDAEDAVEQEEQVIAGKEKVNKADHDGRLVVRKSLQEEDESGMEPDCRVIVNVSTDPAGLAN